MNRIADWLVAASTAMVVGIYMLIEKIREQQEGWK